MKRILLTFIILLAAAGGGFLAYAALRSDDINQTTNTEKAKDTPNPPPEQPAAAPQTFTFAQTKKAAHYVSSNPAHETVLDSAPAEVSITFNFDLSPKSTISVAKDGQDVSTGAAIISADKLMLTKAVDGNAGSGLYAVQYNACWPDGSCHDGQFQFGVR